MDIYAFALQMEQDGEKYYRQLMEESPYSGLKKIFQMLADAEVIHARIINNLREKNVLPQDAETPILKDVKNVFLEMKQDKEVPRIDTTAAASAYRKARDIEQQSLDFYREKAREAEDGPAKTVLERLAAEEEKHLRIMENLVEFVTKPEPGQWLENAEWHHLDTY